MVSKVKNFVQKVKKFIIMNWDTFVFVWGVCVGFFFGRL